MQVRRRREELTDGVNTTAGAGVTTSGASRSGRGLRGSIGDGVTTAGAPTLEGVVETDPVTDFVGDGLAPVVVGGGASGERE